MTVDELIVYLQKLSAQGKGSYKVIRSGYADTLLQEDIEIESEDGEVWI